MTSAYHAVHEMDWRPKSAIRTSKSLSTASSQSSSTQSSPLWPFPASTRSWQWSKWCLRLAHSLESAHSAIGCESRLVALLLHSLGVLRTFADSGIFLQKSKANQPFWLDESLVSCIESKEATYILRLFLFLLLLFVSSAAALLLLAASVRLCIVFLAIFALAI